MPSMINLRRFRDFLPTLGVLLLLFGSVCSYSILYDALAQSPSRKKCEIYRNEALHVVLDKLCADCHELFRHEISDLHSKSRYINRLFKNYHDSSNDDIQGYHMQSLVETYKLDVGLSRLYISTGPALRGISRALETLENPLTLRDILDTTSFTALGYPDLFQPHPFRDITDFIIGWYNDAELRPEILAKYEEALLKFHTFWIADPEFTVPMLGHFIEDAERDTDDIVKSEASSFRQGGNFAWTQSQSPSGCLVKIAWLFRVFRTVLSAFSDHFTMNPHSSATSHFFGELLRQYPLTVLSELDEQFFARISTDIKKEVAKCVGAAGLIMGSHTKECINWLSKDCHDSSGDDIRGYRMQSLVELALHGGLTNLTVKPSDDYPALLTDEYVEQFLSLAKDYQLANVIDLCEKYLLLNWKQSTDKVVRAVELSAKFSNPPPMANCTWAFTGLLGTLLGLGLSFVGFVFVCRDAQQLPQLLVPVLLSFVFSIGTSICKVLLYCRWCTCLKIFHTVFRVLLLIALVVTIACHADVAIKENKAATSAVGQTAAGVPTTTRCPAETDYGLDAEAEKRSTQAPCNETDYDDDDDDEDGTTPAVPPATTPRATAGWYGGATAYALLAALLLFCQLPDLVIDIAGYIRSWRGGTLESKSAKDSQA